MRKQTNSRENEEHKLQKTPKQNQNGSVQTDLDLFKQTGFIFVECTVPNLHEIDNECLAV